MIEEDDGEEFSHDYITIITELYYHICMSLMRNECNDNRMKMRSPDSSKKSEMTLHLPNKILICSAKLSMMNYYKKRGNFGAMYFKSNHPFFSHCII